MRNRCGERLKQFARSNVWPDLDLEILGRSERKLPVAFLAANGDLVHFANRIIEAPVARVNESYQLESVECLVDVVLGQPNLAGSK